MSPPTPPEGVEFAGCPSIGFAPVPIPPKVGTTSPFKILSPIAAPIPTPPPAPAPIAGAPIPAPTPLLG